MSRTPPGPRGLLTLLRLARRAGIDPLGCFLNLAQTYGDLIMVRVGPIRFCLVNHPDLVREVLVLQTKSFRKPERFKRNIGQSGRQWPVNQRGGFLAPPASVGPACLPGPPHGTLRRDRGGKDAPADGGLAHRQHPRHRRRHDPPDVDDHCPSPIRRGRGQPGAQLREAVRVIAARSPVRPASPCRYPLATAAEQDSQAPRLAPGRSVHRGHHPAAAGHRRGPGGPAVHAALGGR